MRSSHDSTRWWRSYPAKYIVRKYGPISRRKISEVSTQTSAYSSPHALVRSPEASPTHFEIVIPAIKRHDFYIRKVSIILDSPNGFEYIFFIISPAKTW
jgi:hypothetical protein